MKNIKAILFDLDDTLMDDISATYTYRKAFHDNHRAEIPYSFDEFNHLWDKQVIQDLINLGKGTANLNESRLKRMRIVFDNPHLPVDYAVKLVAEYLDSYMKAWKLFDDAIPALEALSQRYILGMVTNGDNLQQRQKVDRFNLGPYFKTIVTCEEAGASKPEKQIFDFTLSKLDLRSHECLFVGDSYDRDVVGALNVGLHPVWLLRNGDTAGKALANIQIIQNLTELTSLLAQ